MILHTSLGIQKSQEAEINTIRAELTEKEQAFSCLQFEFEALKKELTQIRQSARSVNVSLELKEYELEQMRQLRRMAEEKLHCKYIYCINRTILY